MYLEATRTRPGQTAKLETPVFKAIRTGQTCGIFFAYHMYSSTTVGMGTLNVSVVESPSNQETLLFSKSGNQGNQWYRQTVSLPTSVTSNFKVHVDCDLVRNDVFKRSLCCRSYLLLSEAAPIGLTLPSMPSNSETAVAFVRTAFEPPCIDFIMTNTCV